jgi:hypothetical protein
VCPCDLTEATARRTNAWRSGLRSQSPCRCRGRRLQLTHSTHGAGCHCGLDAILSAHAALLWYAGVPSACGALELGRPCLWPVRYCILTSAIDLLVACSILLLFRRFSTCGTVTTLGMPHAPNKVPEIVCCCRRAVAEKHAETDAEDAVTGPAITDRCIYRLCRVLEHAAACLTPSTDAVCSRAPCWMVIIQRSVHNTAHSRLSRTP